MSKMCEIVVKVFSILFFRENKYYEQIEEKKSEYTLSSVFPTKAIMDEARKYL